MQSATSSAARFRDLASACRYWWRLSAALVSLLISPEQSAPLAYISGTLGVLIGADLLRLKDISRLGTPYASIGGAGTFDGIFITGIVAALLV